ncbi:MAG: hypothetical protein KHW87_08725 [Clostridiales bacterium]|nr:hypothetical protein [Clostridiales bacterium]
MKQSHDSATDAVSAAKEDEQNVIQDLDSLYQTLTQNVQQTDETSNKSVEQITKTEFVANDRDVAEDTENKDKDPQGQTVQAEDVLTGKGKNKKKRLKAVADVSKVGTAKKQKKDETKKTKKARRTETTMPTRPQGSVSSPALKKENAGHTVQDQNEKKTSASLNTGEKTEKENEAYLHYAKQTKILRRVRVIAVIVLISFLVMMVVLFRDSITIENLQYFLRYLDTRQAQSDTISSIPYDSSSVSDIAVYKGGLAMVDSASVSLYDLNGDVIMTKEAANTSPLISSGDTTFLVYNIGGNTVQMYNSLTCLFDQTYDNPISCAAVNNDGMFFVGTRSMEYRSVIDVYNKNFELIYQWFSPDKYLMCADLKDGGDALVTAAIYANEDGSSSAVVSVYRTNSEDVQSEITLTDQIPLSVHFQSNGGIVLITDRGLQFYDDALKLKNEVTYTGYVPVRAESFDEYSYFALNKNVVGSQHEITVTDRDGNVLFSKNVEGEITDCTRSGDMLYFLMERQLVCVSPRDGRVSKLDIDAGATAITATENDLLICRPGVTDVLSISTFHTNAETLE